MTTFPALRSGDEIRVIAPSQSYKKRRARSRQRAQERLQALGYKVTFGKNLEAQLHLNTAKALDRAADFNAAFADPAVKAVMALSGGWSANELLPLIDWGLVTANPKPFIGFSDITVLLNAIYAKSDAVGYLGPNFLTLGRMTAWQYTVSNLQSALQQDYPPTLRRSQQWGSKASERFKTKPWKVLQPGQAEGVLIGGNLGTFYLLQGTEYQPKFDQPFILVAEDDDESGKLTPQEFSRRLESILQLPNVRANLRGMIIGRFQPGSHMTAPTLASIIAVKQLCTIPVVCGVDFGHTLPMLTLPIGGQALLTTNPSITFSLRN